MASPLVKPKIIKKVHLATFRRYVEIKCTWKKTRDIDKVHKRFKDQILMLTTGHREQQENKAPCCPVASRTSKELEVLQMWNKLYCAGIIHNISSKNRKTLWKEQPSWPQNHHSQHQAAQRRK
ncbi:60S ribosomal protein L32 [Tupaia chinensis]|uniref:60S ribosomal protein L32 n=1 Tax=Tupaia chinensis TaxID=246437 RepID=L9L4T4_TUPCH|nr:60S ribosomal protein L32 [Tupaia chinensis]ELW69759.1 60S ribosomal protein L32 [Tupaia chinensis]